MQTSVLRALSICFLAGIMLLAAACSDDDDIVAEPDVPAGTGSGTPEQDVPEGTVAEQGTSVISEETEAADETPGEELQPPDPESTSLPLADRTVTPDDPGVGPQDEGMFPDIRAAAPELENYTLTITGEIDSAAAGDDESSMIDLDYKQSDPETFHLSFDGRNVADGEGENVVEAWQVDNQMWIRDEGQVEEAPDEFAGSFDISSYLSMLPEIERISDAEEVGQEDVNGRTTTRYSVSGSEAVDYLPDTLAADVDEGEGTIDVWVDDEDGVVLRMTADLTWSSAEGDESTYQVQYEVTAIGETDEITVPTS